MEGTGQSFGDGESDATKLTITRLFEFKKTHTKSLFFLYFRDPRQKNNLKQKMQLKRQNEAESEQFAKSSLLRQPAVKQQRMSLVFFRISQFNPIFLVIIRQRNRSSTLMLQYRRTVGSVRKSTIP